MRYTETELDKIIRIGCARIDQAVERVIEKHCHVSCDEETQSDNPENNILYAMFSGGNLFSTSIYAAQAQAAMLCKQSGQAQHGSLSGLFGGVL